MKAMSTFGGEDAALFFIMQIQKLSFKCVGSLTSLKWEMIQFIILWSDQIIPFVPEHNFIVRSRAVHNNDDSHATLDLGEFIIIS